MRKFKVPRLLFVIITLILSTLLAFSFEQMSLRRENILLVYVVSIMLIVIETRRMLYGVISTFFLVFVFNFFFTEPKYTFIIDDANYIITIIIFMIAVSILSTLTTSLQNEIHQTKDNEEKIEFLYALSNALIITTEQKEILSLVQNELSKLLSLNCFFYVKKHDISYPEPFIDPKSYAKEIDFSLKFQEIVGCHQENYKQLSFMIYPTNTYKSDQIVLCVDKNNQKPSKQEIEIIETALLLAMTANDNVMLLIDQEINKIEIEKEKLKNALLRSISHDLRTPLTSLQSGTSFLYESFENLDTATIKDMLMELNNETVQLSEFVENLLNLTRMHANQLVVKKEVHLVSDIFSILNNKFKNRLENHFLFLDEQDTLDTVYADLTLILQVFTNLIDNAIKHTPKETYISVIYYQEQQKIFFEVKDNGGGISDKYLKQIFTDFLSLEKSKSDSFRGFGLGLSICKAIIEAHGGQIIAYNNEDMGTTFKFYLPESEVHHA